MTTFDEDQGRYSSVLVAIVTSINNNDHAGAGRIIHDLTRADAMYVLAVAASELATQMRRRADEQGVDLGVWIRQWGIDAAEKAG